MDRRYQVAQRHCMVGSRGGDSFMVYRTGQPGWFLFRLLDPNGVETSIEVPHRLRDLKPVVARAIRAGVDYCLGGEG